MNKHLHIASAERPMINGSYYQRGPGLLGSSQMAQPAEFLTHSVLQEAAFDNLHHTPQKSLAPPKFQDT